MIIIVFDRFLMTELMENVYYCEICKLKSNLVFLIFRNGVFFSIGKNITVIIKIESTFTSWSFVPDLFFFFFSINCPPCVHAASLGTTTHGCALTRPSLCRLSRQWGTDTGSDTIERDPSLLSLSITSMRRVCVDVPDVPQQLTDLTSVV